MYLINCCLQSAATHNENKENNEPEPAQQAQADQGDHLGEILMLNTTIQELRSKLESVRHLEEEKSTLKNGKYKIFINKQSTTQPHQIHGPPFFFLFSYGT